MDEVIDSAVSGTEVTGTTAAPEAVTTSDSPAAAQEAALNAKDTQPAPAYQPNYKFKAYDKEHEMDEWTRALIKDKETEEKFRSLYAKGHGIEEMKGKLEKYRNDYQKVNEDFTGTQAGLDRLKGHVSNGDFDAFFKETNIPLGKVWEWVEHKIKYNELSQEDKRRYDEAIQVKRQNMDLANKANSTDTKYQEVLSRQKQIEMKYALSEPETKQLQQSFDERIGRDGAFQEFVAEQGYLIEQSTGKDCPVEVAVKRAIAILGNTPGGLSQPTQAVTQVVPPGPKPVIPNIKGGSVAPVKKRPQNLKEMRADIAQRMASRQQ